MRLSTRLLLCCGAVLPSLLTPAAGTSIPASAIVKSLGIAETSQNQPRYNMQQVVTREKGVTVIASLHDVDLAMKACDANTIRPMRSFGRPSINFSITGLATSIRLTCWPLTR